MLSNALVIPHFDYRSTVWSNFSTEFHNKLQVLNNNLEKIILSADIRTPINEMMDALEWVRLDKRWHDQLLLIIFKCLTVVACTSGNLVIQVQHGFSFKKIG